jgi:hypothetical protein
MNRRVCSSSSIVLTAVQLETFLKLQHFQPPCNVTTNTLLLCYCYSCSLCELHTLWIFCSGNYTQVGSFGVTAFRYEWRNAFILCTNLGNGGKGKDITICKVLDFLGTRFYRDSEHETRVVSLGVRLPCRIVGGCKNCGRIHSFLRHVSLIMEEICSYKTLEYLYQSARGHSPNEHC